MFDVQKPISKPSSVIRPATASELSDYEKRKLANIEDRAQENRIEVISLSIDGSKHAVNTINKEAQIELGKLATKSVVTPADVSSDEFFIIKCELNEADFE
jgi:ABC-type Zn uptake system ZnuABC Zn-binding protein ZnuA